MLFDDPPKNPVKPYDYFATPDGYEVVEKLWYVLKPVGLASLGAATVDVFLKSKPKGYLATIGRYIYITVPLCGAAATFVVVSNLAGSIRKEDDKLNWFLGGAAAGSILGVWRQSTPGGFVAAGALGFVAFLERYCHERGFDWLPSRVNPQIGGIWSTRQDWTLTKHRPGNWVTKE